MSYRKNKLFSVASLLSLVVLCKAFFCAEAYCQPPLVGGYFRGQGDSIIDFDTCMSAGVKFLNFRGWYLGVGTGKLSDIPSTQNSSGQDFPSFSHLLNDFLNGLAANPDVVANLALTTPSDVSISPFLDRPDLWPTFIEELQKRILPYLGPGKFSGLELDFEYPAAGQEEAFTNLCVLIKQAVTDVYPEGTVTIATWAPPSGGNMDVKALYSKGAVDYFEPMIYAYSPGGTQATFMNKVDQFFPMLKEFEEAGVPFSRVIPMLALYSMVWTDVPPGNEFGLFQNAPAETDDTESNVVIIDLILQNPNILHFANAGHPISSINSWVYVPTDATSGTFYSYTHPLVAYSFINTIMQEYPDDCFERIGFWYLNADTTTLFDTGQLINLFNNSNWQ